ncbi:hypothetical protein AB0L88_09380 [Saccharopolyspora shandongensis]|uniref:hypothetical protein n=1 Tax=Saccharopolyspora shandongensis TaxID=418495 RepID=UPI003436F6C4
MRGKVEECEAELKALRRGWGLSAPKVDHIGPVLRGACGVADADGPAEVVGKVSDVLRRHAARLPGELRIAVLTALGLHEPIQARLLTTRQKWLADELLDRDVRTARRRIDDGSKALAQLLTAPSGAAGFAASNDQWHTEWMQVVLALDQPAPEAFVFRRVVADGADIAELDLAMTLPRNGPAPAERGASVDVFAGGTLIHRAMESSERIGLVLRLPKPLAPGERHDVVMRVRVPQMQPYYVCVPKGPCEEFDLSVRFGDQRPQEAGLLDKVFQNDLMDDSVRGTPLELDAAGEVRVQFTHLAPGFAYGIRWDCRMG